MVIETRSSTQGKTEKTGEDISADTADKVCKDVNMQLVDGKAKTHPVLVDLDASDLPFASESLRSGGCCEGCIELRSEIKEMRQEIERLTAMSAYSNLPAETRSSMTSENMQIIERLWANNTSLIKSVEALSQQLLRKDSNATPNFAAVPATSGTGSNPSCPITGQTYVSNEKNEKKKQKKKRKKKKQKQQKQFGPSKNSAAIDSSHDLAEVSAPLLPSPPGDSAAAESSRRKTTTVIAGDSLIKNIIGAKMSASDQDNYFVVKHFPGATVSDVEDYVKPLVRRSPENVILHVGTNDLRSCPPRNIADSILNLVTQVKQGKHDR